MQTRLGGQMALDRDDDAPVVDIEGAHCADRVSTGGLASTPTRSCGEDDGQPGHHRVDDGLVGRTGRTGLTVHTEQQSGASVRRTRPDRRLPRSYRGIATFLRALLMLVTRRDWRGAENFPSSGGFVVCPNHISYVDPFAFAHFLYDNGHPPFFLGKSGFFEIPIIGRLVVAAQQIPVARGTSHAAEAFAAAVVAVESGKCVPIFPEGTLTRDPQIWPM